MAIKTKHRYFYGIYGIQLIWHGSWSDPELIWHRKSYNYYSLEDWLWEIYTENEQADPFEVWVKKNASLARECLESLPGKRIYN